MSTANNMYYGLKKQARDIRELKEENAKLKAEVEDLKDRLNHEVAMIDGAAKDDIRLLNNTVEILNQIRDNLQDENRKLNTDLAQFKTRCEKLEGLVKDAGKLLKYSASMVGRDEWLEKAKAME